MRGHERGVTGIRGRRRFFTRPPGALFLSLVALVALLRAAPCSGEVFLSKREALNLAFPGADRVEKKTYFLAPEQKRKVESLAGVRLSSKLFTFYVGAKDGKVLGYAAFDVHIVRTHPEAFLLLLGPAGTLRDIILLAFYEPREYRPPKRWLEQFQGRVLTRDLRVGREVHGIAGSTLTSRAVTGAVRKVLALYQILIGRRGE